MTPPDVDESWGCVIGRFQPFHLDHLSLAREVMNAGQRLIIAITNVEPSWRVPVDEAPHRHMDSANPFTYAQRVEMVRAALLPLASPDAFRVTPFPIHDPSAWSSILAPGTQCWVRDRGPWESRKMRELAVHYPVQSVPALSVERSGTEIRRRMRAGNSSWADDVPPTVAALIGEWLSDGRLILREDGFHGVAADGHDRH
jgi:cytidyltransferase-like protein